MQSRKNSSLLLAGLFAATAVLGACAAGEQTPPPQVDNQMDIAVDFREVHLCSRISPEITVAYAPKGTKFYDVRLVEGDEQGRFLGGGTWQEDGTGLIPEGALTRHYSGPCPPKNKVVEYTYVVSALAEENGQPLAVRLFRFKPEN